MNIKIKVLDKYRDITNDGRVVQKLDGLNGRNKKVAGTVWKPGAGYRYPTLRIGKKRIPLHRIIWELFVGAIPYGHQIDHINGDKHDNRLENLRVVTPSENSRAFKTKSAGKTSKFRGVCFSKRERKFKAYIGSAPDRKYLGTFCTEKDAALAFNEAARDQGYLPEAMNRI